MRQPVFLSAVLLLSAICTSIATYGLPPAPQEPGTMPETMAPKTKITGPTGPLSISFAGKTAEWTPGTLAALPHKTISVFNAHSKTNQSYSGVPLSELLTRLGVPGDPHGTDLRLYVTARGADGYFVVLSAAEANPGFHSGDVLVADALEGKPITDPGPLQLIVSEDKRPARWVHGLVEIRVATAE